MKLRWTTTEIDPVPLLASIGSLNSHPWRGFDAESVRLDVDTMQSSVDGSWTVTVEPIPTTEKVPGFTMWGRADFNAVVPESAVEV